MNRLFCTPLVFSCSGTRLTEGRPSGAASLHAVTEMREQSLLMTQHHLLCHLKNRRTRLTKHTGFFILYSLPFAVRLYWPSNQHLNSLMETNFVFLASPDGNEDVLLFVCFICVSKHSYELLVLTWWLSEGLIGHKSLFFDARSGGPHGVLMEPRPSSLYEITYGNSDEMDPYRSLNLRELL